MFISPYNFNAKLPVAPAVAAAHQTAAPAVDTTAQVVADVKPKVKKKRVTSKLRKSLAKRQDIAHEVQAKELGVAPSEMKPAVNPITATVVIHAAEGLIENIIYNPYFLNLTSLWYADNQWFIDRQSLKPEDLKSNQIKANAKFRSMQCLVESYGSLGNAFEKSLFYTRTISEPKIFKEESWAREFQYNRGLFTFNTTIPALSLSLTNLVMMPFSNLTGASGTLIQTVYLTCFAPFTIPLIFTSEIGKLVSNIQAMIPYDCRGQYLEHNTNGYNSEYSTLSVKLNTPSSKEFKALAVKNTWPDLLKVIQDKNSPTSNVFPTFSILKTLLSQDEGAMAKLMGCIDPTLSLHVGQIDSALNTPTYKFFNERTDENTNYHYAFINGVNPGDSLLGNMPLNLFVKPGNFAGRNVAARNNTYSDFFNNEFECPSQSFTAGLGVVFGVGVRGTVGLYQDLIFLNAQASAKFSPVTVGIKHKLVKGVKVSSPAVVNNKFTYKEVASKVSKKQEFACNVGLHTDFAFKVNFDVSPKIFAKLYSYIPFIKNTRFGDSTRFGFDV